MSNSFLLAAGSRQAFRRALPGVIRELVNEARMLGLEVKVEEEDSQHIVAAFQIPCRRPPSPQTHYLSAESQEWEVTYIQQTLAFIALSQLPA